MFIKQPLDELLEFEHTRIDDNHLNIQMPIKDLVKNSAGIVHGGVISALADVTMSNLVPADDQGTQQTVTVNLDVSFVRPATGKFLLAKASIEKQGRTLVHAQCSIYNDQDALVATTKAILFRK